MDSSYLSPYKNVFRGSSESQRLARINATPYDSFNDSQTSIASTASQKLVSFFKDKMSGVVSGLKGFFNPQDKPLLSSVVLTNSVTLPYIPPEKLNSISSAIQDTMKKPEYQDKYNFSLNSSMVDSRKSSVQNVMKYYKDVSVDKVREKIQRQDSKALDLSVSCAVKPRPVYSSVNTSINSSRLDLGYDYDLPPCHSHYSRKNDLNVHGKRELRSILHDQNKTAKGNKKVSFVPELKRVDFPSHRNPLIYQKSSSSIIKYTSSDDEDGTFVDDQKQKKLFANSTKIFIKPQTLNVSVIPTRKLKVNPFQKKILEKSSQPKSHKIAKKQFPEDFARKFNHENSFGSDNLVNDSKLETDSDESNLHQNTFDHKNFINSLAKKKNQRSGDYDSSSEISEKESPKQQLQSPKNVAQIPLEEDEVDIDADVDREESNYEEEEKQMPVEEPVKKLQEPAPVSKPSSLFGNLTAAVATETKPTENNTPKLGGGLFSNSAPAAETKKETTSEAPKSSLFSFGNNSASTVSAPKETTSSGLFGGNTSTETKAAETPKPTGSLFGSSLFGNNKTEQKPEEPKPAVVETPKETTAAPIVEAQKPAEEKPAPITRSDSQVHSIFANLNRSASTISNTNNPFLSAASSQPKPVNFSSLIGGNSAAENKPAEPIVESQPQNNETTMESNNQPAAEPAAPKLGGFLGLISQNNNQGSSMFSNTLNTSTSYSWMSTENTEQKSNNLFGGMINQNNNNQSSMFTQNAPVNPFGGSQGGMNFESGMENNNNNSMFGGNPAFGNNNNSGNPFTGLSRQGSSMNNGLFGGSSMGGGMFGNSGSGGSMENNPFLSNQNSFGGGSGGFSGGFGGSSGNNFMGSGGGSFGGSAKKGKQKERAF